MIVIFVVYLMIFSYSIVTVILHVIFIVAILAVPLLFGTKWNICQTACCNETETDGTNISNDTSNNSTDKLPLVVHSIMIVWFFQELISGNYPLFFVLIFVCWCQIIIRLCPVARLAISVLFLCYLGLAYVTIISVEKT